MRATNATADTTAGELLPYIGTWLLPSNKALKAYADAQTPPFSWATVADTTVSAGQRTHKVAGCVCLEGQRT